jgi:hypothetical protein
MKQTLLDYCRDVDSRAAKFARAKDTHERRDHLDAYNFGRMVERMDSAKSDRWMRIGWLLAGVAIGVALGTAYPHYLYPALAHQYFTKAILIVREAGKSALGIGW